MKDKMDLIIARIDDLKDSSNNRLDSIDTNLAEHMRRTDGLENLHRDNQDRISILEEPRKALKLIKTTALWLSAISGAILIIIRLFGKL